MIANTKNGKKKIVVLGMNLFIQQYLSNANMHWKLL